MTETDTSQQHVAAEAEEKLALDVRIDENGACERHIVVTVSAADVERYRDRTLDELVPDAFVPGFRPGKAPRQLVANHYRQKITDQVKALIVQKSLAQLIDEKQLIPISEPDLDLDSVEIADDGHLTFEFDLEVRPEFELPQWKGLSLVELRYEPSEEDIQTELLSLLRQNALVSYEPVNEPAQLEDLLVVRLSLLDDGKVFRVTDEVRLSLRPTIYFRDARIDNADQSLCGARAGDTVDVKVQLAQSVPDERWQGRLVDGRVEVLEVKRARYPELNALVLGTFGVKTEAQLREAIRHRMEQRFAHYRDEHISEQVTELLLKEAHWDLPPRMLRRQLQRELERLRYELWLRNFSVDEIEKRLSELRGEALEATAKKLRRHFILERIAEEEEIEASNADLDAYIQQLAEQREESPRRVRARLEKSGDLDVVRNLIVEQRVLDLIRQHAQISYQDFSWPKLTYSSVPEALFPETSIPEARHDEPESPVTPDGQR
ncbi:MAG: trigger factor [Pirellulaceae bacterium]|nr:MAG: trigger factor [Pirellulaceae bacterium]